ncbi:protein NEGATIVE GRAVITROPIC RESPONSE OF ROOTS-like isoform X2 [Phragmites australis]|uniref:protein NEGATIVE GRAVITROPIC RESPONSE OF ROOTS-like isoform X2 n=1 Tax=Phragmites australis TaxID=29695 RepID=UPI002D79CB3E|nr:protein NEGATIVE GRAVITROPIC RESPONSE OF ROOTS-like isoform X2 [Phragmites australis]
MGIINWVQSRFHGKTEIRRFDGAAVRSSRGAAVQEESYQAVPEAEKHLNADEWPQAGLLSVGTLGNEEPLVSGDRCTVEDLPEFTVEEVEKLQDALARLLRRAKSKSSARGSGAGEDSPPLDRFLNYPSSLEVDRRVHTKHGDGDGENGDLSPDTKIILTMARDLLTNTSKGSTRHKSLKFLLKKAFVWNGGFTTLASSLKDLVESRMEKFFRTVLGEKINARPSNGTTASRKYFLEDPAKGRRQGDRRRGCEEGEKEESCRWDRTDSEFIVLEI